MEYTNRIFRYFTKAELILWSSSTLLIIISFILFDRSNYIILAASLVGVTSLIYCAKGNPLGQFLIIVFSLLYGIISYRFSYYGEMITYLGMTAPIALSSLISWIKNPYKGNKAEVKINKLNIKEIIIMIVLTSIVTYVFYNVLRSFDTSNLLPSTISVTTSFLAVYLTFRRSAYYAIAYALNDVILIVLWILAAKSNTAYLSVVICFMLFLVNDGYGFINWPNMYKRHLRESER